MPQAYPCSSSAATRRCGRHPGRDRFVTDLSHIPAELHDEILAGAALITEDLPATPETLDWVFVSPALRFGAVSRQANSSAVTARRRCRRSARGRRSDLRPRTSLSGSSTSSKSRTTTGLTSTWGTESVSVVKQRGHRAQGTSRRTALPRRLLTPVLGQFDRPDPIDQTGPALRQLRSIGQLAGIPHQHHLGAETIC